MIGIFKERMINMKLTTNDLATLMLGGIDVARENIAKRQKTFPCLSTMDDFEILEQHIPFSDLLILESCISDYQNDRGDTELQRKTTLIKWWLNEITTEELLKRIEVI
jgi:hypothetical protein